MSSDRRITDAGVAGLDLSAGRAELLEEIMSEAGTDQPVRTGHAWTRWGGPLAAAAAVVAIIVGITVLMTRNDAETPVTSDGGAVCWDGSSGPACPTPAGKDALSWVFPRLAGKLDTCRPADKTPSDDPPMPFGTPSPGRQGPPAQVGAAYRCDLDKLGIDAAASAPRIWVYALGAKGSPDIARLGHSSWIRPRPFSIGGERAGQIFLDEVGLVHPSHLFLAVYAHYPFAVMGFADDKAEAEQILAALGARKPSEMVKPGVPTPSLPAFPSPALQSPMPTP